MAQHYIIVLIVPCFPAVPKCKINPRQSRCKSPLYFIPVAELVEPVELSHWAETR